MIRKIAKITLLVTGVLLLVLIICGIVLSLNWPWWTGLFILLGFAGIIVGIIFLKKILDKRKEDDFVNQVIQQDEMQLKSMADKEKDQAREMQESWKEAITTLKNSHLKKAGNPLYVLPWYLVIGESGSGKTTAIKGAKLSSPFAAATAKVGGISGTRNCDWWFFEQAIIIDTAGRYAIPVDESRDTDEWRNFLPLLSKYRKKEPLNGLIVTISADKLLESSPEALAEDGRKIRARIDELMLALGSKFPVYVMVTKCDMIQGMTQFCDRLPEASLTQAMGLVNHNLQEDADSLENHAVDSIDERLRNCRLLLLHEAKAKIIDPALILFPDEFSQIRTGLKNFITRAFQENPYQETPILRGIFFSSGRQEGTPYSHFLASLGLIGESEVLPGTSKGLFLHDFFGKILPRDRGIFAPTQKAIEWSRLTRNLGLTSWAAIVIAICGLLSFSFVKNMQAMRSVSEEFLKPALISGEVLSDVATMNNFRRAILQVEKQNQGWWIPRFGLNESIRVEQELKKHYSHQLREGYLVPLDRDMENRMTNFSPATPDKEYSQYVTHLVRRINLLKTALKTREPAALTGKPQPPYKVLIANNSAAMIPEIKQQMADVYLYYLLWSRDTEQINSELIELRKWLRHIIDSKGDTLHWLVVWANSRDMQPVRLRDFWTGTLQPEDEITVAPAFTSSGKEAIDNFILELESALPDPGAPLIARRKFEFNNWYRKKYILAWHDFAANFKSGVNTLASLDEWRQMLPKTATDNDPYLLLFDRLAEEFSSFAANDNLPAWLKLIFQYQNLKAKAKVAGASDKAQNVSLLQRVGQKGSALLGRAGSKLDQASQVITIEDSLKAARALNEYKKELRSIVPLTASQKESYELAVKVFKEESTPFAVAHQQLLQIKSTLATGEQDEKVFWQLLNGPMYFIWNFIRIEAACHLQDIWEKDVLAEAQGITDQQRLGKLLMGNDGLCVTFIRGPAAPFISRSSKKGYYAVKAMGGRIAFEPSFLNFLTKGVSGQRTARENYNIIIKGLPTDSNSDSSIQPHATHLMIQCSDGTIQLDNYQYPIKKAVKWSPTTCGDVHFQIEISDLILNKRYTGSLAFAKFLKEFRTGERIFYPKEFPDHEMDLKLLGVKYIKAKYKFDGNRPIIKLISGTTGSVPRQIVKCWASN